MQLRSALWFDHPSKETRLQHRSAMRANGHDPASFVGKPIIGIFNSWNDFNSCNAPHKELVEFVKRGVLLAGGYPIELHTITTSADLMKESDLPYRNLMAMDIEELTRCQPIDGLVLLCECDKTTPAQLMAAASCDLPALQLAAGHRAAGTFRGKPVYSGTDLWAFMDDYRAGLHTDDDLTELEACISCAQGGCPVMGTASTMKSMAEMLGMMLPGTSAIPASDAGRKQAAEATGRRIVTMVQEQLTPSRLMTKAAFHNAIKLLAAIGGSTNAVLHLIAIAGRLGIRLELDAFSELSRGLPLLVDLQPSGQYGMDDFYDAGGLSAVIRKLLPLLDSDCLTALGVTVAEAYGGAPEYGEVIAGFERPVREQSGIAVLRGNLAPDGAVLKRSTSDGMLRKHRGRAIVFDDYEQMLVQLERDDLDVDAQSVLVLRNCGPVGAGMPEWGAIPLPKKLVTAGVRDMLRISDARMSGTSYGTVVLHVSPEAALGGPLAIVRNGDWIEADIMAGSLRLDVPETEIATRMQALKPLPRRHKRGYLRLYGDHVLQAHEGCDLDFLRPQCKEETVFVSPVVGRG